jgi:hypothetical protein
MASSDPPRPRGKREAASPKPPAREEMPEPSAVAVEALWTLRDLRNVLRRERRSPIDDALVVAVEEILFATLIALDGRDAATLRTASRRARDYTIAASQRSSDGLKLAGIGSEADEGRHLARMAFSGLALVAERPDMSPDRAAEVVEGCLFAALTNRCHRVWARILSARAPAKAPVEAEDRAARRLPDAVRDEARAQIAQLLDRQVAQGRWRSKGTADAAARAFLRAAGLPAKLIGNILRE